MKAQKMNGLVKNIFLGIFVIMIGLPLTSCAKKIPFLNSSVVPAAKGFTTVKIDSNKNFVVKINVSDLAEVERLQTAKLTYVAWMETDQGNMENLGQLKSLTSFFSKRHKASLETVTPYKPTKVFITSESDINVQYPGTQIVLTTNPF